MQTERRRVEYIQPGGRFVAGGVVLTATEVVTSHDPKYTFVRTDGEGCYLFVDQKRVKIPLEDLKSAERGADDRTQSS